MVAGGQERGTAGIALRPDRHCFPFWFLEFEKGRVLREFSSKGGYDSLMSTLPFRVVVCIAAIALILAVGANFPVQWLVPLEIVSVAFCVVVAAIGCATSVRKHGAVNAIIYLSAAVVVGACFFAKSSIGTNARLLMFVGATLLCIVAGVDYALDKLAGLPACIAAGMVLVIVVAIRYLGASEWLLVIPVLPTALFFLRAWALRPIKPPLETLS